MLGGAQHGEGLHVDHLGVDRIIGRAGNDAGARRERSGCDAGHAQRQGNHARQVEERRFALRESQRRGIHIAIGDAGCLIDAGLLQNAAAGGAQRDQQIGHRAGRFQPGKRCGEHHAGLHRADARHERRETALQVRPVFRRSGHDEQHAASGNRCRLNPRCHRVRSPPSWCPSWWRSIWLRPRRHRHRPVRRPR